MSGVTLQNDIITIQYQISVICIALCKVTKIKMCHTTPGVTKLQTMLNIPGLRFLLFPMGTIKFHPIPEAWLTETSKVLYGTTLQKFNFSWMAALFQVTQAKVSLH